MFKERNILYAGLSGRSDFNAEGKRAHVTDVEIQSRSDDGRRDNKSVVKKKYGFKVYGNPPKAGVNS